MKIQKKLLNHPFYQLWTNGEITEVQLAKYSQSYFELIEEIPNLWSQAISGLNAGSFESQKLINEEIAHIELWNKFKNKQISIAHPSLSDIVSELFEMNPSQLLGAIHSFEVQQPEVAKTKKEGLLKFYGFSESDTKYFDEHMNESEHIQFGKTLADEHADKTDFEYGFLKGSEIFYNALDRFLN